MDEKSKTLEQTWALVELFGHTKTAGQVTEVSLAGAGFLRVDVPAIEDGEGFSAFYGPNAVYSIKPCSEEIARAMANYLRLAPINVYTLRQLELLPGDQVPSGLGTGDDGDEDDWDDDEDPEDL